LKARSEYRRTFPDTEEVTGFKSSTAHAIFRKPV
jgi:hypothetical protein